MLFRNRSVRSTRKRSATVTGVKARSYWPGSSRPIAKTKSWVMSLIPWVKDHPGGASVVTGCLITASAATLALVWAPALSVAIGLAAALTIGAAATSGTKSVLDRLERRRSLPYMGVDTVALSSHTSAAALPAAEPADQADEGGSDEGRSDEGR
jgi:hypothetical protein